ncbi:MAG: zinc ABC transporter substrate-binding protein [Bdellovibrionales bacterium]|nr:zinc ABC transporter substrate-binding protein [Bdellovibrionales bacterium]
MKSLFLSGKIIKFFFVYFTMCLSFFSEGKLKILTSTTSLKSLTELIAGDRVELNSILRGGQDPHFISPKPSYMLRARKSQLLIFIGLDLEVGWLPSVISGSKNLKIQEGQPGHLDASQFIKALSVSEGKVDRFFGDIHPYGNPHYLLDPLRAVQVSLGITNKLIELDSQNKDYYLVNHKKFETKIKENMKLWRKRIKDSGIKNLVSYHSSFEYFLETFEINLFGLIEEKPGIAPSAKHIMNLIKKMKENQISCIMMSSFYSPNKIGKIKNSIPVHIEVVDTEVGGIKKVKDYFELIEAFVQSFEKCGTFVKNQKL